MEVEHLLANEWSNQCKQGWVALLLDKLVWRFFVKLLPSYAFLHFLHSLVLKILPFFVQICQLAVYSSGQILWKIYYLEDSVIVRKE